jgi:D-hexose-6-phosphate mutarotase
VSDVRHCRIAGLAGTRVFDKVADQRRIQTTEDLVLSGWTDQVHLGHSGAVTIADPGWQRRITVSKTGSASTVVWNPWSTQALKMSDFAAAEWPGMLCVEAGNCLDDVVVVAAGSTRRIATTIAVATG